jgi:GDP-4-dehydro-6-deoxy-D-mannose reductase
MPKLFVTGLEGFVGSHLAREALAEGWEVAGIRHPSVSMPADARTRGRVECVPCNLLAGKRLGALLKRERPQAICHLAAVSFVPEGEGQGVATIETNVGGTQTLLEAARLACPDARMLVVSSGEVYGGTRSAGKPLSERSRLRPRSLYGVSKAAMELVGDYYQRHHGLHVVVARPFNHIGPGQSPRFVSSSFARQIAQIETRGGSGVLGVGNLESERDFTDVRDVVRAYLLLLRAGRPGRRYNVCSGQAVSIRSLLAMLFELTTADIRVDSERSRVRRGEVTRVFGDNTRIRRETGWRPLVPLRESLADILSYWRTCESE